MTAITRHFKEQILAGNALKIRARKLVITLGKANDGEIMVSVVISDGDGLPLVEICNVSMSTGGGSLTLDGFNEAFNVTIAN